MQTANTTANKREDNKPTNMENMKTIGTGLLGLVGKYRAFIKRRGFWSMALLCLLYRCLVMFPIGPLLALFTGTVWVIDNQERVGRFFRSAKDKTVATVKSGGAETSSLWYDNGGAEEIDGLIVTMKKQGCRCCNLVERIKMPPQSHWQYISKSLNAKGILTQVSKDAFFIVWDQNTQGA